MWSYKIDNIVTNIGMVLDCKCVCTAVQKMLWRQRECCELMLTTITVSMWYFPRAVPCWRNLSRLVDAMLGSPKCWSGSVTTCDRGGCDAVGLNGALQIAMHPSAWQRIVSFYDSSEDTATWLLQGLGVVASVITTTLLRYLSRNNLYSEKYSVLRLRKKPN